LVCVPANGLLLVVGGYFGQCQQDHGEFFAGDLSMLVGANSPHDGLLESSQILGIVIVLGIPK